MIVSYPLFVFYLVTTAAAFINKTNEPEDGDTARLKRARSGKDPRAPTATDAYLRPHVADVEEADGSSRSAWRPNWGIRKKDSIVGDSRHAIDWSYHSITPGDFKDYVSGSTLEGAESAGSQAFAAVSSLLPSFLCTCLLFESWF